MGLDYVELVMRVEEEFEIEISDCEAETLATPGLLCACIERKLGIIEAERRSFCPTSRAFYRVRRELMALGIERGHITPNSALEKLLPRAQRQAQWKALKEALPGKWEPLRRPAFVFWSGALYFFGSLVVVVLFPVLPPQAAGFIPVAGAAQLLLYGATAPLALCIPADTSTVGDIARRVAQTSTDVPSTQRDVWSEVQRIVADELSVPLEIVTRDADFFRDLGAG